MTAKKINLIGLLIIFITTLYNCASKRRLIFEEKKTEINILFEKSSQLEKKKGINNFVAKYLNDAPEDQFLLELINQYTCYYLYELGYKNIHILNSADEQSLNGTYDYKVSLNDFLIKEFKYTEIVEDSTSTAEDKVKLKGIKTSISASITPIINGVQQNEWTKIEKDDVETSEQHEGEFSHTKNLKDIVVGNKEGSTKYLKDIKRLEDGIFEKQCLELAELISKRIDNRIANLFFKLK